MSKHRKTWLNLVDLDIRVLKPIHDIVSMECLKGLT